MNRPAAASWCIVGVCLLAVLSGSGGAWAAGPAAAFTRKPTVTSSAGKTTIAFAVDRETGVAVFIEDASGKVVRHLVAGRLGRNAPPPLKADSLEQAIEWNGKADYDRPAGAGPFTVRVALGLKPTVAEFIGQNPGQPNIIRSFAVGPDGSLYVTHLYGQIHPDDNGAAIAVYDRGGKYLRTIMPYSAALPDEKLKGLRRLSLPDGNKVPFIYQMETRSYVPGLGNLPKQRGVVTRDGRLAFVGILEGPRPFANPGQARLVTIRVDGSVPDSPLSTEIAWSSDSGANLALSPDEKTIYAAGLRTATHRSQPGANTICEECDGRGHGNTWNCTKASHAVYRFKWGDGQAKVFLGQPTTAGDGPEQFKTPLSVATDGAGNVYVADAGNGRVSVFDADGRAIGQIKIASPLRVEVHRKTGAVYVLAGRSGGVIELVKFDGYKNANRVCAVTIAKSLEYEPTRMPLLALDDSADPPILYASPLLRIEDRGATLAEPVSMLNQPKDSPGCIGAVMELAMDRVHDLLYVNSYWRYRPADRGWDSVAKPEGARGWTTMWPIHSTYSSTGGAGLDGNYYSFIGLRGGRVYRYSREMKLLPFEKAEVRKTSEGDAGRPLVGTGYGHGNGITADAAGNVYVIWNKSRSDGRDYHQSQALWSYNPDGTVRKERLIDTGIPNIFSPRVDQAGNIYVAVGLRPGGETLPPGLKGVVPEGSEDPDAVNGLNAYPLIYGSIAKFSPAGGDIHEGIGGAACNFGHGRRIEVKGAEWIVPGASTVTSWATPKPKPGTVTICLCEAACFDVDEFGRSFFAVAGRCRIGVLDTAGNEIGWFGQYGNPDSGKPGDSTVPLAWPQAIAVGNGCVYIGDRVNRRIVSARLAYQAEALAAIPGN